MIRQLILKNKRTIGLVTFLILYCLIPIFIRSPYYLDLFIILLINAVLTMTFVLILKTGLITMGISAFWGLGGYISALLVMKMHLSFWAALPITAILVAFVAWLFSFVLLKNTGFTFVILTSCIGMAFPVIAGNTAFAGGYAGMPNIPPPNPINIPFLVNITFTSKVSLFYLVVLFAVVSVLIILAFYAASTGRAWTAVGMNSKLASTLGINVFKYRQMGFVVASFIAGLFGSFYAHYQGFISPDSYGIFNTIYLQVYAILGGLGYAIAGPLLGSTIMTFFPEFTRSAKAFGPIFTGALLVLLIIFLPQGLLSIGKLPLIRKWVLKIGGLVKYLSATRWKAGNK